MVKKEVFEWIRTGRKTIELRRGKTKKGKVAVFQCGRNILRRKISRAIFDTLLNCSYICSIKRSSEVKWSARTNNKKTILVTY